jgi:hypothetical protein
VWSSIVQLLTHPDTVADELRAAWADTDAITEADLASLNTRDAAIRRKQQKLTQASTVLGDETSAAPLLAELRQLGREQAALDTEREALSERIASRVSHDRLLTELEDGLPWWQAAREWQLDQLPVATRRTMLALLDITVRLYGKGHDPRYDVTAAIPLSVPHNLNDLWMEVPGPINLDFSQTHPPVSQQDATRDNRRQSTCADNTRASRYLSEPCAGPSRWRLRWTSDEEAA